MRAYGHSCIAHMHIDALARLCACVTHPPVLSAAAAVGPSKYSDHIYKRAANNPAHIVYVTYNMSQCHSGRC